VLLEDVQYNLLSHRLVRSKVEKVQLASSAVLHQHRVRNKLETRNCLDPFLKPLGKCLIITDFAQIAKKVWLICSENARRIVLCQGKQTGSKDARGSTD